MGYETPISEEFNVINGKLEIEETRQEYLAQERKNHAGITPAFRALGEIAKKLPASFEFNKINGAKFNLPIINLDNISYEMHVQGDNVVVFGCVEDYGKEIKVFEATFSKDANLREKTDDKQINYEKTVSEGEEMRKILPQERDLVMIDKICDLGEDKVVAARKVNDLDCEGGDEFNKFRLIEMIGQAGSYYILSDVNTGVGEEKKIATYKDMNICFYPAADKVKKDDELVIEVKRDNEDKNERRAHGEVRKKDGIVVFECNFCYDKPRKISLFQKIAQKAKKR